VAARLCCAGFDMAVCGDKAQARHRQAIRNRIGRNMAESRHNYTRLATEFACIEGDRT
jgi:hypothetical protein